MRGTHLDDRQGAGEQWTEDVQDGTSKEQPQPATQHSAKSADGVPGSAGKQDSAVRDSLNDNIEEAILYAKKYLEDLLSFFGLNTDIYATTEDKEVIELNVPSTHLNGFLIGQRGDTMRALQYMISTALKNQNFVHTRVNVDVADYKKHRADRLASQAEEWFKEVRDSGKTKDLEPMNAADRRVVHKAASDFGLETESVGEGRERHIVLKPATKAA
jgi:spoIIIJ-associated protein